MIRLFSSSNFSARLSWDPALRAGETPLRLSWAVPGLGFHPLEAPLGGPRDRWVGSLALIFSEDNRIGVCSDQLHHCLQASTPFGVEAAIRASSMTIF